MSNTYMSNTKHTPDYKVMYLAGWLIFDNGSLSFQKAHRVECDSKPSAQALAAMYNAARKRKATP
jgi:hypothetical protein